MAKRRSEEAKVLDYFTSAPQEKAELMLGLVKDVVRRRIAPVKVTRVSPTRAKRGSRAGRATTLEVGSNTTDTRVREEALA